MHEQKKRQKAASVLFKSYVSAPDGTERHTDTVLDYILFRHLLVEQERNLHAYGIVAHHRRRHIAPAVMTVGKMIKIAIRLVGRRAGGIRQAPVVGHHDINHDIVTEIIVLGLNDHQITVVVDTGGNAEFIEICTYLLLVDHIIQIFDYNLAKIQHFLLFLPQEITKGVPCPTRKAEIIPYELEVARTTVRICSMVINPRSPFFASGKQASPLKKTIMTVFFNQKEISLPDCPATTVADLLRMHDVSSAGVAVAVNNAVVRRADWAVKALSDGDKVMVITAVCGG